MAAAETSRVQNPTPAGRKETATILHVYSPDKYTSAQLITIGTSITILTLELNCPPWEDKIANCTKDGNTRFSE